MNPARAVQQRLWGGKVVVYLFLAGMGAGAYLAGALLYYISPGGDFTAAAQTAAVSAIFITGVGLLFIFSHLGNAANARRAIRRPGSSWLSRGIIALFFFLLLSLVQVLLWVWPARVLGEMSGLNAAFLIVNSLLAFFILIYSGMVLATLKSFPFWHTWTLPVLTAVAELTSGILLLILLTAVLGNIPGGAAATMVSWGIIFLLAQAAALGIFWVRGARAGAGALTGSGAAEGADAAVGAAGTLGVTRRMGVMSSDGAVGTSREMVGNLGEMRKIAVGAAKESVYIMTRTYRAEFYAGAVGAGIIIPLILGIYIITPGVTGVMFSVLAIVMGGVGMWGSYTLKNLVIKSGTSNVLTLPEETVPLPEMARRPASERVRYR